jgi:hypothetical protein
VTTKVVITSGGVLFSVSELIAELSPDESQLLSAYEVVIAYCALALGLALTNGLMTYWEAKRRNTLKLSYVFAPISVLLYGTHLAYVYIFDVSNAVLGEFVEGFAWLPVFGLLVAGTLFVIGRSPIRNLAALER